jgi:23S rRNA (adenine-N6)-dimethyltransferase
MSTWVRGASSVRERTERDVRRRSRAQNFLRSERLVAQLIAGAEIGPTDLVLEVGAGSGILTRALAARARRVVAIELDPLWADRLRQQFTADPRVVIVERDALRLPLPDEPFRVLASLPFNLSTAVLHHLLDDPTAPLVRADLIVQWDVARKRTAVDYGNLLNLTWEPWYEFFLVRRLRAQLFRPVPAVDAGVLAIRRRLIPLLPPHDRKGFIDLVRAGYLRPGARLRAALQRIFTDRQFVRLADDWGFSPDALARDLDCWQWVALFTFMKQGVPKDRWPRESPA